MPTPSATHHPNHPARCECGALGGKTSIYEILCNPKYTGYQVFNRRASRSGKGKVNDPVKWVWSPNPTHEPLIPKWMFDEMTARRQANRGSRAGSEKNVHPETRRTYVLRGMVFCACGRRMFGSFRHNTAYYACSPRKNNRGRPDKHEGHPKVAYLQEGAILDAVSRFFADRVFGPDRREILDADLRKIDDRASRERQAERDGCSESSPTSPGAKTRSCDRLKTEIRTTRSPRGYAVATTTWKPRGRQRSPERRNSTPPRKPSQHGPAATTPNCSTRSPTCGSTSPRHLRHCCGGCSRSPSSPHPPGRRQPGDHHDQAPR